MPDAPKDARPDETSRTRPAAVPQRESTKVHGDKLEALIPGSSHGRERDRGGEEPNE